MNTTNLSLGLNILLLLAVIWLIFKTQKLDSVRKHFYSNGLKKDLETVVAELNDGQIILGQRIQDLNRQTEEIRQRNEINFQKVGMVKYSQHGEAGNLSFSLVLLDAHNNGLLISSLHGREGCRVYSKEISNGKSRAKLTMEEEQAFIEATQTK